MKIKTRTSRPRFLLLLSATFLLPAAAADVEVARGEGRDAEGEFFVQKDVEPAEGVERRRHHGDDECHPAAYDVHVDEGIRIARGAVKWRAHFRADEDEHGVRDGIYEPDGGVLCV